MAFRNPIVAGVALVRSAIESSNFVAGASGWAIYQNGDAEFNAITIRGAEVVDSTQLFYDGAPAAGNLMVSISPTAGTDQFGNDFQAGIVGYDAGGDFIQQANGTNVGWTLHIDSLTSNGQIGLFVMGTGDAMQGVVEIQPPTSSGNGPPILNLVGESLDSSAAGFIGLANADTVQLSPQTAAQTILEYLNAAATIVTGWGAISDQNSNFHFHAAAYAPTFTAGAATFAHGCNFAPAVAILMSCGTGAPLITQLTYTSPIGASNITVQAYTKTGTSFAGAGSLIGLFLG